MQYVFLIADLLSLWISFFLVVLVGFLKILKQMETSYECYAFTDQAQNHQVAIRYGQYDI